MVSYNIDTLDTPFLAIYALMATLTTGIASFTLFGYSFIDPIAVVVGLDLTPAFILQLVSYGAIATFGAISYTDAKLPFRALIVLSLALVVITAWVPEVQTAITGSDLLGITAFGVHIGAATGSSYLG